MDVKKIVEQQKHYEDAIKKEKEFLEETKKKMIEGDNKNQQNTENPKIHKEK